MFNSQLYPWHLCLIKYELDIRGHCFLKLTRVPLWIGMSLYKWKVKTWNKKAADKKHLYFGFTKIWYYNCSILLVYSLLLFHCAKFVLWQKRLLIRSKKYIDQEPPYLMRQIRVLQWEEWEQIKAKNSGATHHFWGKKAQGVE